MKKKALFLLVPLMSVTLSGCAEGIKYQEHLDDYVRAMKYHENFNILQLTDIHWNANTSTLSSKQYLSKTLAEADADTVVSLAADHAGKEDDSTREYKMMDGLIVFLQRENALQGWTAEYQKINKEGAKRKKGKAIDITIVYGPKRVDPVNKRENYRNNPLGEENQKIEDE